MSKNKKIMIDKNRCPANHPCPSIRVCPVKAMKQKKIFTGLPEIDQEKCTKCGKCIKYCPMGAIKMIEE